LPAFVPARASPTLRSLIDHDDGPRFGELVLFRRLGEDAPLIDALYAS